MTDRQRQSQKFMIDLAKLNELNAQGCAACNGKFALGETVVAACGPWEGGARIIHENEAVWDSKTASYVERRCYEARRGQIG
jgi:hypothetical protein